MKKKMFVALLLLSALFVSGCTVSTRVRGTTVKETHRRDSVQYETTVSYEKSVSLSRVRVAPHA